MKYPIKITKIMEGHVVIEAENLEEALRIANIRYNAQGMELPDMDDCMALKFELDKPLNMLIFEAPPKYYVCTTNPMGTTWYLDDKNADDCTLWSGAPAVMRVAYDTYEAAQEKVKELESRHPLSHSNYYVEPAGSIPEKEKAMSFASRKGR